MAHHRGGLPLVVDNRFELVLMATKRARQLAKGRSGRRIYNDKPTVVSLRKSPPARSTRR